METGHPTTNALSTRMICTNPNPVAKRKKYSSISSPYTSRPLPGRCRRMAAEWQSSRRARPPWAQRRPQMIKVFIPGWISSGAKSQARPFASVALAALARSSPPVHTVCRPSTAQRGVDHVRVPVRASLRRLGRQSLHSRFSSPEGNIECGRLNPGGPPRGYGPSRPTRYERRASTDRFRRSSVVRHNDRVVH